MSKRLDDAVLDQIRDLQQEGQPDVVTEIIVAYLDAAGGLMRRMVDSAALSDSIAVGEAAHALKSSSANVGAMRLHGLCHSLEASSNAGQPCSIAAVDDVRREYEAVCDALLRLLGRAAA